MATGRLDAIDLDIDRLKERIAELEHEREGLYGKIEQLGDRVAELRTRDADLTAEVQRRREGR